MCNNWKNNWIFLYGVLSKFFYFSSEMLRETRAINFWIFLNNFFITLANMLSEFTEKYFLIMASNKSACLHKNLPNNCSHFCIFFQCENKYSRLGKLTAISKNKTSRGSNSYPIKKKSIKMEFHWSCKYILSIQHQHFTSRKRKNILRIIFKFSF